MKSSGRDLETKLLSIFNIRSGEGQLILLLLIHSFLIGVTRIFTRTAAFTLFLVEFDAQTLPYVYMITAVVDTVVALGYLKLGERLSFSKLLAVNLTILLLGLTVFWLGLGLSSSKWLVLLLPIWFNVIWILTGLEFFGLTGHIFNVRQSKRLLGLAGSGMWAAVFIGGLLVPLLVEIIGTLNLLLVAAVGMAGALVLLFYITTRYMAPLSNAQSNALAAASSTSEKISYVRLFKNGYIILIGTLIFVWWISFYFIDNMFYTQAAARYPTEAELARFIGPFFAVAGLLTFLINSFVAGPVIGRYGLRGSLLIVPAILFAGTLGVVVTGTVTVGASGLLFGLTSLIKLTDIGLGYSLDKSAQLILYQPMSSTQRMRVLTLMDGVIHPLAAGLAGILLLSNLFLALSIIQLSSFLLLILTVWIGVALLLGRAYSGALMQALIKRKLSGIPLLLNDSSSVTILHQALRSPYIGVVIYALDTLERNRHETLSACLQELLDHPVPEIRQETLHRIERLGLTDALEAVRRRLELERSTFVRAVAIRTLAALGELEEIEQVYPFLEDPDLAIRAGAIVGLLRNGGPEVAMMAGGKLIQLAISSSPFERTVAAQVLGEVHTFNFYQLLPPLLDDQVRQVRRKALIAAGKLKHPKLWPLIIAKLSAPDLRQTAVAALVTGGEAVLPTLEASFEKSEHDSQTLIRLAQTCGRIRGEGAIALLKTRVDLPDEDLRTQILRSLHLCNYQAQSQEIAIIHKQLKIEIADAAWTLAALVDIGDDEPVSLLHRMLMARLTQIRTRIIYLLSFIYDPQTIIRARDNLNHAHPARRAYALEALDLILSKDHKATLLPLLSDRQITQQLQDLSLYYPQPKLGLHGRLHEIVAGLDEGHNGWIKACTLHTIDRLSATTLIETVVSALSDQEPLIRETALWTLFRLNGNQYRPYINSLCQDQDAQVARTAQQLTTAGQTDRTMLSMIEKVIFLKTVALFSQTPIEILSEVALLLQELKLPPETTVFKKGEQGDCLYIVIDGQLRVHDEEKVFDGLGPGDEFGELALLDSQPRTASITTTTDTSLLRLDQSALFELMDDRIEIAQGIIRVLSQHLRFWIKELNSLQARHGSQNDDKQSQPGPSIESIRPTEEGNLSTIEKVIILKTVNIFSEISGDVQTALALLLTEVKLGPGETIFEKGALGNCMYIIVEGQVKVHNEGHLINYLEQGDLFGEMALLDPEPRLASVTAIKQTLLLQLEQEPFYELMENQVEMAQGIIGVLTHHLRARIRDVDELRAEQPFSRC